MASFGIAFLLALVFSSVGFKYYIWFISVGYGFSIAAIGAYLLIANHGHLSAGLIAACVLLIVYGLRLGGYLLMRDLASAGYKTKMKGEIKSGSQIPMVAKCGIWVSASALYACETSPVIFRIVNGGTTGAVFVIGLLLSVAGLVIEAIADLQKNWAKQRDPYRFVSSGLYRVVRCPNYFGEMLFWTGFFVGGLTCYRGVLQWIIALVGYVGIIYIMFSGARRLELRQNRTYGKNLAYKTYVRTTPIMVPLVPLYSVAKYRWLVG